MSYSCSCGRRWRRTSNASADNLVLFKFNRRKFDRPVNEELHKNSHIPQTRASDSKLYRREKLYDGNQATDKHILTNIMNMKVTLSVYRAKTTEPIQMKFSTQIVLSLRTDMGYYLPRYPIYTWTKANMYIIYVNYPSICPGL